MHACSSLCSGSADDRWLVVGLVLVGAEPKTLELQLEAKKMLVASEIDVQRNSKPRMKNYLAQCSMQRFNELLYIFQNYFHGLNAIKNKSSRPRCGLHRRLCLT